MLHTGPELLKQVDDSTSPDAETTPAQPVDADNLSIEDAMAAALDELDDSGAFH